MTMPEVSVVMSVYNGAAELPATLDSILIQTGCDFEFIVVNDGSTDASAQILASYAARDARLRVIAQENKGLTQALIRGCAEARGEFIARQDCGDISLPGRLAAQVQALRAHPQTVMVASGVRFVGPQDEPLYELVRAGPKLAQGLQVSALAQLKGPPHHGSTLFRRTAYQTVGGYRAPFVVAQDIDLWLRLVEQGEVWGLADVYYQAKLVAHSISHRRRDAQFQAGQLALRCARQRRSGQSDAALLATAPPLPLRVKGDPGGRDRAKFYYFIGACLRKRDPVAARRYFQAALRAHPFCFRALARTLWG